MVSSVIKKIFGSRNDRILKRFRQTVAAINALEAQYCALSDSELANQTAVLKQRLDAGQTLEMICADAFAVVREAAKRVLSQRHYDVQLIGGLAMHAGMVAEMSTGEGKTLCSTLPVYLNALSAQGVHVVTVNPYLAQRDAQWMGQVYAFLGLTTGVILPGLSNDARKQAYACDITYGTNNEFGFDYLRDNMAMSLDDKVQRQLHYALVDEVDSILIDESRTPLIISGQAEESSEHYQMMIEVARELVACSSDDVDSGDYLLNEKDKQVTLTDVGHDHAETLLRERGVLLEGGLYDLSNIGLLHYLNASLRAAYIFKRDVDYVVVQNEVVIVDEHTGRAMTGRRWSDGLHQALEAKEGVSIQHENQTLASITFQNYFRLYHKLSGMTGTADTEAHELHQIYGLEVVVIPTNKTMIRKDQADLIYLTKEEKYTAVLADIKQRHANKQPILVGTTSIENSEYLSQRLTQKAIPHQVLNAKFHEQEAQIIAQAGRLGAVTIATNMAGRGTDIVLGGVHEGQGNDATWAAEHQAVVDAGGLHVLGTERHESRRIDNQLRGRSGRQGDPGSSQFYLSLQDNLMRVFASDKVSGIMRKLGMEENETVTHPWLNKAIENTQRKVEGHYFDIRKQLLKYDDVINDQRKVIYEQRNELMGLEDVQEALEDMRSGVLEALLDIYLPDEDGAQDWDLTGLNEVCEQRFGFGLPTTMTEGVTIERGAVFEVLMQGLMQHVDRLTEQYGAQTLRQIERGIMLETLDERWKEHLAAIDHLRQGIHFRGYAQKNPAQEFKKEAYELFQDMLTAFRQQVVSKLALWVIEPPKAAAPLRHGSAYGAQQVTFGSSSDIE